MGVKVQVIGLTKAVKDISQYWETKKKELVGAVALSSEICQKTAKDLANSDLGDLKSEIISTVKETKTWITGDVLSAAEYSSALEFGTVPHYPPVSGIEGWAQRHGWRTRAIIEHIGKHGTKAHPYMTPAAMRIKNPFIKDVITVFKTP